MSDLEKIHGRVRYSSPFTASLVEDSRESLLAIDVPPFGNIQEGDIRAAFNHLSAFQGLPEGAPLVLLGFRDQLGMRAVILISRIVRDERVL